MKSKRQRLAVAAALRYLADSITLGWGEPFKDLELPDGCDLDRVTRHTAQALCELAASMEDDERPA